METSYQLEDKINSKGGKVDSHLFSGMNNIFQLPFITMDIWELIDELFDPWENISISNQKVKNCKPIICTNSKIDPDMKQLLEDMTFTL